jgi:hypothetical protein
MRTGIFYLAILFFLTFNSCKPVALGTDASMNLPKKLKKKSLLLADLPPIPRNAVRIRGEVLNFSRAEAQTPGMAIRFIVKEIIGYGEDFSTYMVREGEIIEVRTSNGQLEPIPNDEKILDLITMPERVEHFRYQQAILLNVIR